MVADERLDVGALKRFTDDGTRAGAVGVAHQALRVLLGLIGAVIVWVGLDIVAAAPDLNLDELGSRTVWRLAALATIGIVTAFVSRFILSLFAGSLLLLLGMIAGGFWTSDVVFDPLTGTELGSFLTQGAHNAMIQTCFAIWLALGLTSLVAERRRAAGSLLDHVGDGI